MMRSFWLLPLFLLSQVQITAAEISVANAPALEQALKTVKPGDTLLLAEGDWADVNLKIRGEGTPTAPITVKAAKPGKTILTGSSRLRVSGQHIHVEGLWFRDPGIANSEVIELRTDSDELASYCIIRDCAVTHSIPLPDGAKESKWCSIYGTENIMEHCTFTGKKTGGTTLVVWLTEGGTGKHHIRHCYFGPRSVLGKNGGETIRIGDSKTSGQQVECIVEGCLFHECNGEGEIISNKSCGNRYIGNTFLDCEGALTLRHGHRCTVTQNWFIGHGKKLTGGVRVIGEDHQVLHNTFMDLAGEGYRCGLTFMRGDTKSNGYQQVRNTLVANNTWVNCVHTVLIGMAHDKKCTLLPEAVVMRDNVMLSPQHTLIQQECETPGWTWEGNLLSGASVGISQPAGDASSCKPDAAGLWRMPADSKAGAQMKTKPLTSAQVGPRSWKLP